MGGLMQFVLSFISMNFTRRAIVRRVGMFLCPRGFLIRHVLTVCFGLSMTAWAQKHVHPTMARH